MRACFHFIVLLAALLMSCGRPPSFERSDRPDDPFVAKAQARAVRDGLTSKMSDGELLRAVGQDPAKLTAYGSQGVDGYSMIYTNQTTYISITRSVVSGISVIRLLPKDQHGAWIVDKK